jgi:hypothetical protein
VASPADAVDIALAGERARRQLRERGMNPDRCKRLVRALENGVAGVIAARELAWDVASRYAYVDEVQRRLEEEPESDHAPQPPLRSSLRIFLELNEARRQRDW